MGSCPSNLSNPPVHVPEAENEEFSGVEAFISDGFLSGGQVELEFCEIQKQGTHSYCRLLCPFLRTLTQVTVCWGREWG